MTQTTDRPTRSESRSTDAETQVSNDRTTTDEPPASAVRPRADTRPRGAAEEAAEEAADAAVGLDMVLVDAGRGPLRRLVPPAATTLRLAWALARRPRSTVGRSTE